MIKVERFFNQQFVFKFDVFSLVSLKMTLYFILIISVHAVTYTIGIQVACPKENEVACVECSCNEQTGFNVCMPMKACPGPVKSLSEIKPKNKRLSHRCHYGHIFKAQCSLCDCSGEGHDHCALCFALPTRRIGQSAEINKKLPQPTDNRFFNYEINGWEVTRDYL